MDLRDDVLDAYVLDGGVYRRAAQVVPGAPAAISFGVAELVVDLGELLR